MNFLTRDGHSPEFKQLLKELFEESLRGLKEDQRDLRERVEELKRRIEDKKRELNGVEGEDYIAKQKRERLSNEIEALKEELESTSAELTETEELIREAEGKRLFIDESDVLAPVEIRERRREQLRNAISLALEELRAERETLAFTTHEELYPLFEGIERLFTGYLEELLGDEDVLELLEEAEGKLATIVKSITELLEEYEASELLAALLTATSIQELESFAVLLKVKEELEETMNLIDATLNGERDVADARRELVDRGRKVKILLDELQRGLQSWRETLEEPKLRAKYLK